MVRTLAALLVIACASSAQAQGILNRAGEALDNAGRNIRQGVENAVARTEVSVQERDLATVVINRIRSDKRLMSSVIQTEIRADGSVVLRGSAIDAAAKKTAVELVENTIGVTAVVDELALMKDVKVIEAKPTGTVIERTPAPKVITSRPVAPAQRPVVVEPPAAVKP